MRKDQGLPLQRRSGILLHVTSLPSVFGIGDLGPAARQFVDFLAQAEQAYWQVLPLNPTNPGFDSSPYHSVSALAFNTLLISPEMLAEEGLLESKDLASCAKFRQERVDYQAVIACKNQLFDKAFGWFKSRAKNGEFTAFCAAQSEWLEDYALFMAAKAHFKNRSWHTWPKSIRDRDPAAERVLRESLAERMQRERFLQYVFFKQWQTLRAFCCDRGIQIIGDMPIYIVHDSADLWTHPELFKLRADKKPQVVAGVPPDYFSASGQLWGNPLYRWDILRQRKYDWWIRRMGHNLKLFDIVRIDHFRGFVGYWEVPTEEKTAQNGRWVKAPAEDFFQHLRRAFDPLPVIAEDLGTITPDVREIMRQFGFPGMKVLLFAFGEDDPHHPYLPHNHERNCVVYTGTHDNNTVRGWFEKEARIDEKKRLFRYLRHEVTLEDVSWAFVQMAMTSPADTAILPMQDVLGLSQEARMNRPATGRGNWRWRLLPEQMTPPLARKLAALTRHSGRSNQ